MGQRATGRLGGSGRADTVDLAVIGGGSAGLVTALVAAGIGARVTLIEADRTGGDCLWTGCVPSKALLSAAHTAHAMRTADRFGIDPAEPVVDLDRVLERVRSVQADIEPHDSPERLRREGVEVIAGRARFVGSHELEIKTADGTERLSFRRAVIATGSSPSAPPINGLEAATPLTTDTVWGLRTVPQRLAIIGGGPVGCELGQAFSRLGSTVTIIEAEPTLLPRSPRFAGELLADALRDEGVTLELGAHVTSVNRAEGADSSPTTISLANGGEIVVDQLLVAAGRRASTTDLGLDTIGVELDRRGHVVVDEHLRSTVDHIFAAGDVTGVLPLTSVASVQAKAVAPNAVLGTRRTADVSLVPIVTYTDPEVATVGLSEIDAREKHGSDIVVTGVDHGGLDRSRATGATLGRTELIGDTKGRLVGATVVGPAAGEIVGELAAWMHRGAKITDISAAGRAYPTFAESATRAADEVVKAGYDKPWLRQAGRLAVAARRLMS